MKTIDVTPEQYWQLKRLVSDIEAMEHTGRFRGGQMDCRLHFPSAVDQTWNYGVEKILGYRLEPCTEYILNVVRG